MALEILQREKEIRQALKRVLNSIDVDVSDLLNKFDLLPTGNVIFELEQLWSTGTAVKSFQSFMFTVLKNFKVLVILKNSKVNIKDLEVFYGLGLFPAVVDADDQGKLLATFFAASGYLGGVVVHDEDKHFLEYVKDKEQVLGSSKYFIEVIVHGRTKNGGT